MNKGLGSDPLRRTGGSVAFTAAARSVLLLAREPNDPEGEQGRRRVLAHVKCNVALLASSLAFEVTPVALPATDAEPDVDTASLVACGDSPHSGRELLAAAGIDDSERSALEEAESYLREAFPEGPRRAAEIKREGKAAGIAERTLERARQRLGIESVRDGFRGPYIWHPPATWLGEVVKPGEVDENRMNSGEAPPSAAVLANPPLYGEVGEVAALPRACDTGFRDRLNRAHDAGQITGFERHERRLWRDLLLAARRSTGEDRIIAEVAELIAEGVLQPVGADS